jgi:hypothetical protein
VRRREVIGVFGDAAAGSLLLARARRSSNKAVHPT